MPKGKASCLNLGKSLYPLGIQLCQTGKLLEDFWESDWSEVEADFQRDEGVGANIIRIHLQVGKS